MIAQNILFIMIFSTDNFYLFDVTCKRKEFKLFQLLTIFDSLLKKIQLEG